MFRLAETAGAGSAVWLIGQLGDLPIPEDRDQAVADGYFEPAACFNDRHDRCDSGASPGLSIDVTEIGLV